MQLYLDSYGAFLAVRNGMLAVRTKSAGEKTFALRQVKAVLMTKGAGMSVDAALLAATHDIPILLIDANTHAPLAQLSSGRSGSIATIRKNQAIYARRSEGFAWVAQQLALKTVRQRALLESLCTYLPPVGLAADIALADRVLAGLQKNFEQWQAPVSWDAAARQTTADHFRGQEGTAARIYFQQIAKYVAGRVPEPFEGRQARPAYDGFNALLNYLYGMLHTQVHLALLKSGLDPFMGILHADRYGDAPTLAFDLIEPYRPWADAVATRLAADGCLKADWFESDADTPGCRLATAAKSTVIDAMLLYLQEKMPHGGRNLRRSAQIDLAAQQLAVFLKSWAWE